MKSFNKLDFYMRARDKVFHVDCFRCVTCNQVLKPGDEFALRGDGFLYCKQDNDFQDRACAVTPPNTDVSSPGSVSHVSCLSPNSSMSSNTNCACSNNNNVNNNNTSPENHITVSNMSAVKELSYSSLKSNRSISK